MGSPKYALKIKGKSFLQKLESAYLKSSVSRVVVTLPEGVNFVNYSRVTYLANLYPELEYSGSILTATDFFAECNGIIVNPIDAPFTSSELINSIVKCALGGSKIVVPTYESMRGHPIYFSSDYFSDLKKSSVSGGPREVMQENAQAVRELDSYSQTVLFNINTKIELQNSSNNSTKKHASFQR